MARPSHRPFPLSLVSLALAAALLAPAAVLAQAPIEQQMSPEAFKAAGLDKLSARELANLNAWLNNTLQVETSKAATEAKEQARKEEQERNFANIGLKEPIEATLVGEFHGFGKGRRYTLDNGQVWEQIDEAELLGVHKTNPKLRIKPTIIGNAASLMIEGYNTSAKVRRIK